MTPDDLKAAWLADLETLNTHLTDLLLDDEMAWGFRAMALKNDRLRSASPLFLDMLWFGYIHRTAIRLRAMADRRRDVVSYVRLLDDIGRNLRELAEVVPEHARPTRRSLHQWRSEFEEALDPVRAYANAQVTHWSRDDDAVCGYNDLRRAVYEAGRLHQRLYFTFTEGHLHLMPTGIGAWMSVFRFPWWPDDVDRRELEQELQDARLEELAKAEKWPRGY